MGADRLYVAERSTGTTLWPHGQNLPHHGLNLNSAREDKRSSQTHYEDYEHIESAPAHHGKRRHRVSPMRFVYCPISVTSNNTFLWLVFNEEHVWCSLTQI